MVFVGLIWAILELELETPIQAFLIYKPCSSCFPYSQIWAIFEDALWPFSSLLKKWKM